MIASSEWSPARISVLIALMMAAVTAGDAATSPQAELGDSLDPSTVLSRIMRSDAEKTAQTEPALSNDVMRKLRRSRMSAPEQANDAQTQTALDELVRRVRSVTFEAKEREQPAVATFVAPEPAERHPDTASARENRAEQVTAPAITMPAASQGPLSAETAEALKRVLADPNRASEPLELAELLYLTGRTREAAILYRKALERASGKELRAKEDRAWILLQLGNCLRESDPAQAKEMYARLIADHADSPWVELAKAYSQLITWYEQIQPRRWVAGRDAPPARQVAASQKTQP